jgi:hypothetical protein
VEVFYWQLLRGYKYLFEQQEEHARSVLAHVISTQSGSETGELYKHRDKKCDSFSACKGRHPNADLSATYCCDVRWFDMLHDSAEPYTAIWT